MSTIVQALIPPALHPALPGLVASHGSEAVLVLDDRGRILHESPALVTLFGVPERPRLGVQLSALVLPSQRSVFSQALANVMKQGTPQGVWSASARMQFAQDGLYQDVSLRLVDASSAEPPCWLVYVRPQTEDHVTPALMPLMLTDQAHTKGHLRRLLQAAMAGLRANRAEFWRFSQSRDALVREMEVSANGGTSVGQSHQAHFGLTELLDYVKALRTSSPVLLETHALAMKHRIEAIEKAEGLAVEQSSLTLDQPVWLHGRLAGLVSLQFHQAMPLTGPEQTVFLSHLSTLVALALESARARALEKIARGAGKNSAPTSDSFSSGDIDVVSEHSS